MATESGGSPGALFRYYDPRLRRWTVKLRPGDWHIARNGEVLTTVLGSCVSVCLCDPELGLGGMNHFMLPGSPAARESWLGEGGLSWAARYGEAAMEQLVNGMIGSGARRQCMEVKLFGGASMESVNSTIGRQNIEFALSFLQREGLPVKARHLGGSQPRRLLYLPESGRSWLQRMPHMGIAGLRSQEEAYALSLAAPASGTIELF